VRQTLEFLRTNLSPEMQSGRDVRADATRALRLHFAHDWDGVEAVARSEVEAGA
jgi:hypothetical protein